MKQFLSKGAIAGVIVCILLFAAAAWWGNALVVFLLLTVSCAVAWYFVWAAFERSRNEALAVATVQPDVVRKEWNHKARTAYRLASFSLLSIIYIAGIITLGLFVMPREKTPYFLNADYHSIYNSGVSFQKNLTLYTSSDQYNAPGIWSCENGTLAVAAQPDKRILLESKQFFTPVFLQVAGEKDSVYTPVNLPYKAPVENGFTLSNGTTTLKLSIQETDSAGFFSRLFFGPEKRTIIRGIFQSTDEEGLRVFGVGMPFKDDFSVYLKTQINTGLPLDDLLLRGDTWQSHYAETRQILEHWLSGMGNCYVLADHEAGTFRHLVFFPSNEFISSGYNLYGNDGAKQEYSAIVKHDIPVGSRVYCGFGNNAAAFTFQADGTGSNSLVFRRPQYFSLKPKGVQRPQAGIEYIRSLYNHYSGFIGSPLDEGYLFHEDVRKAAANDVSGTIRVTADKPGLPLHTRIFDARLKGGEAQQQDGSFSLRSAANDIQWRYSVRDFSQHRMAYGMLFGIITGLYLLIALVLFFFPSPSLVRIEPLIYYVLFALVFVRVLLLWRIATFPPSEDATPRELDSYLSFDFKNGLGSLLPNTALYLLVFFAGIIGWRLLTGRKDQSQKSAGTSSLSERLVSYTATPKQVVIVQILVLVACMIGVKLGPHIGADIITRISSILIPVGSYLVLCRRLLAVMPDRSKYQQGNIPQWMSYPARWFYYFYDSPEFLLSLVTLVFLLMVDRGFAVLFLLFLLFKNIAVSFARRPFTTADTRFTDLIWKPHNYWIYGFFSLALYLVAISWRGMFHQLLLQRRIVAIIFILLAAILIYIVLNARQQLRNRLLIGLSVLLLLIALPFTWRFIDRYIRDDVKYVSHRASLIYMPVDSVINQSTYNSFEERKILETAESQWFVNSYLNKPYDPRRRVNLRPYFDAGVDYTTQTRDVVLPRFVISELGNAVMLMLLVLLAVPLIFYFLSYRVYTRLAPKQLTPHAYSAMLSIVLLFTVGLFVWLTSTNRFVFFGQDFPFLSLTSRLSVILPLMLLLFLLLGKPPAAELSSGGLQKRGIAWATFLGILVVFIIATGRPNLLNERDFTVRMAETETLINNQVNDLLQYMQDTATSNPRSGRPNIFAILNKMRTTPDFQQLSENASPYSRSILKMLSEQPAKAFQPESPVYLRYDDEEERYSVTYNRNVYLELPAYEEGHQWTGNVYEYASQQGGNAGAVTLNSGTYAPRSLPYVAGGGPVKVAVIPAGWLYRRNTPLALVNVENSAGEKDAVLSIYLPGESRPSVQEVRGYVQELPAGALAYVVQSGKPWQVRYEPASGKLFAANHYINGRQRLIYPLASRYFWIYQYARTASSAYTNDTILHKNAPVTLDYNLTDSVEWMISASYPQSTKAGLRPNFRFAVIAADGDGNIRLMSDFTRNRKPLDPNNRRAIARLEQEHFFRSSTRLERDQWGNVNLLHLAKGPGSSVKPIVAAAVAEEVNAGWGELNLNSPGTKEQSPRGFGELRQYGGFDLKAKPWRESHDGDFQGADFLTYIRKSNNLYHSLIIFLGSYPKASFEKGGQYALNNVLSNDADGGRNTGPIIGFRGSAMRLAPYRKGGWPRTALADDAVKTYFGNKESVLAKGLSTNYGLYVDDDNKADRSIYARTLVSYGDTVIFDTLAQRQIASFLWSFPEESSFIQQLRAFPDPMRNFIDGLRNPTLGGTPYNMTPVKMAEMYGRLATQNASLKLHIAPREASAYRPFQIDNTWAAGSYQQFLQSYIYKGMEQVLGVGGTGVKLFGGSARKVWSNGTLFCYAKTGTIGSEGRLNANSRRLELILSNKDLTTEAAGTAKIYTVYFTADQIGGDHNWALYRQIIDAIVSSSSFKNYMQ